MPRLLSAALLLLATACAQPRVAAPAVAHGATTLDASGVHQFWHVASTLQSDREPSSAEWDSLFATPGYAALESREHRRAAITNGMRAALMPSRAVYRDSILKVNGWTARVVRHVQSLPARRAELDAYLARAEGDHVVERAAERAQHLLPAGTVQAYGLPIVSFVFFLPDGRGYPQLIVADLANTMRHGDAVPFFAHEATHFYHARLHPELRRARAGADSSLSEAVLPLLTKIEEESIGDQFDKLDVVRLDSAGLHDRWAGVPDWRDYLLAYQGEWRRSDRWLAVLDSALTGVQRGDVSADSALSRANRALPMEGRPLGMYVAQAIRCAGGDAALARVVGDPIGYFLQYGEAAGVARCAARPLSPQAIALLKRMR